MTSFLTLLERELYRFGRLAGQTLAPPVITTILFILIFGYSLGRSIREIEGIPYILFILPGLAGMGVINNAFANTSTSLFMARMDRSIENLLVAPFSCLEFVLALLFGGVIRGILVGSITFLVASLLIEIHFHSLGLVFLFIVVQSVIFSSLGMIAALMVEEWDHLATFSNFVMTPLVYLGGVFYSIHMLPGFWRKVAEINPIFFMIDGLRYAALGVSDLPVWKSLGVSLLSACVLFFVTWALVKKGHKLLV